MTFQNLTARNIDHELCELSGIAGTFWVLHWHGASMPGGRPRCQRDQRAALFKGAHYPFPAYADAFLAGGMLAGWAWATWWIPLLLLLEIWKHGTHRIAFGYTPMLWVIVFPLGMYAVATHRLAALAAVPVLQSWSLVITWVAFAAWCATASGMVSASVRNARMLIGLAHALAGPTAGQHLTGRR